jgi:hypothetical protein
MNWKGFGRKQTWPNGRYCLEGLRKIMKNLSQDSQSPHQDLNLGPPKYKAGIIITQPQRSGPYVETVVGDYQSGFHQERSTMEHIFNVC